jgi:hypothetical protein
VLVVILSAVVAVVGSIIGSGAPGGNPDLPGRRRHRSGPRRSLPSSPTGPIYLGFLTLAIWQALPAHRTDPRQHRAGWWLAAAMILNAVWIA